MGNKFGDAYREEQRRLERQLRNPRRSTGSGDRNRQGNGGGRRQRPGGGHQPAPQPDPSLFGTGEWGATDQHTAPVHGVTWDGMPVTAAFGMGDRLGQTYLADGHVETPGEFWGPRTDKRHDDYDGRGGGTQRGYFTGYGS